MAVTVLARWSGGSREDVLALVKRAKEIMEGHGAEEVRLGQGYSGVVAGEWVTAMRFSNWEQFGKTMEAASQDSGMAKLYADVAAAGGTLVSRGIIQSVDL